jgi:tRNA-2-methylthio-N6-dimethylallyladenosine synthase
MARPFSPLESPGRPCRLPLDRDPVPAEWIMKTKYVYVYTTGCQMNVYDSEQIVRRLTGLGYQPTNAMARADLIVLNTCTIREKAQQKAFSFLGRLAGLKRKKPGLIIGAGGCVAQQEGPKILDRMPHVDLVFGTQAIERLPELIRRIETEKCRLVDVQAAGDGENLLETSRTHAVSSFVSIMQGCDNFCSYCVVPYVRGPERSRDPDRIIREIASLTAAGVKEVTLLGQNVNSYGKKEGLCSFAELLRRINALEQLVRIRFTTSHPKDLDDDLVQALATLEKLCHHIHLPVQAGSDRILKAMNRKYTKALYLDKVRKLRDTCLEIAITSDIIVGFPGETEADFEETLDLLRAVEFDGLFAFIYSDRPNVPAVRFANKISEQHKTDRLQRVLALQDQISIKKHAALVGTVQSVLVAGLSKKQPEGTGAARRNGVQWTGRTSTNRIVNFSGANLGAGESDMKPGQIVDVRIERAFAHSLWGRPAAAQPSARRMKGEIRHVA